jgi:putative DNA primase/helicase
MASNPDRPLPHNLEAERSVLGSIILESSYPNPRLKAAAEKLKPSDFFLPQNATIFREMLAVNEEARPIDLITITERLQFKNELEQCGGVGYISSLIDGVPRVSNVAHYAAIVQEKSAIRTVMYEAQDILRQAWTGLSSYDELRARMELMVKQSSNGHSRKVTPVDLTDFLVMNLPPVEWIIHPVLPMQGSAMVYAWRGKGKTFFLLTLGMQIATAQPFFGWTIERPHRMHYVDGEMPANYLQERLRALASGYEAKIPEPGMFHLLTPDLLEYGVPNIATGEGQRMIEEHLREGDSIILDNLSCLARTGKSQNDDETWAPIQDWILRLRRLRITTVLVHHAGKGGTQRGTSAREDMLDTVIKLKEPLDYETTDGARFEVHFEKTRRSKPGDQVFPFELKLEEDQRGGVMWLHKPLRDIIEQQAAMLFADNMSDRDVMDALKLDRFKVYRLKKKFKKGEIAVGRAERQFPD